MTQELRVSRTSTWWFDSDNLLWRIDYSAVYEHFSKINHAIKRVHYQTKGGKTIIIKVHYQIRVWPCIVRLFLWKELNSKFVWSKLKNFSDISLTGPVTHWSPVDTTKNLNYLYYTYIKLLKLFWKCTTHQWRRHFCTKDLLTLSHGPRQGYPVYTPYYIHKNVIRFE